MPDPGGTRGWLERAWYGAHAPLLLRPLEFLYRLMLLLRRGLYGIGLLRSAHPGVPTIVVGNLTVGGTGKTPLSLWLAARLRVCGRNPGLVLRGYGGSERGPWLVQPGDTAARVGDEAVLLARRSGCLVAVGAHRVQAARLLARSGCDIVIADDGLQHLALKRDLSVLVVDGARGLGNGAVLPAGPLREPCSALRRADLVVLHGEDQRGVLPAGLAPLHMRLVAQALRRLDDEREVPLQELRGRTVHALAGIGNPERFFAQLRLLGASPIEHPHADHARYHTRDLALPGGHWIVMTEKDAVKCASLARGRTDLYYLQVRAELPEADATRLLDGALAIRRM